MASYQEGKAALYRGRGPDEAGPSPAGFIVSGRFHEASATDAPWARFARVL